MKLCERFPTWRRVAGGVSLPALHQCLVLCYDFCIGLPFPYAERDLTQIGVLLDWQIMVACNRLCSGACALQVGGNNGIQMYLCQPLPQRLRLLLAKLTERNIQLAGKTPLGVEGCLAMPHDDQAHETSSSKNPARLPTSWNTL